MNMSSLIEIKQREKEDARTFIEHFRQATLKMPSGMPDSALIDTCKMNLHPTIAVFTGPSQFTDWASFIMAAVSAETNGKLAREHGIIFASEDKRKRTSSGNNPDNCSGKGRKPWW